MSDDLNKWAKDNNQFFKLDDGQYTIVTYKGFKVVPNNFDPDKEQIRYTLLVDGQTKYWNSSSTRIAEAFAKVKVGDMVKINKESTENGKGKYFVTPATVTPTESGVDFEKELEGKN